MGDRNNNEGAEGEGGEGGVRALYAGGAVLVTGGTGFVGKALVEKLVRGCPELRNVYVLIRAKRGLDPHSRFRELLDSTVFDRIKRENAGALKKIVPIPGDLTEPELGLCARDRGRLLAEVTVVFHSAATVRFNEPLKDAVKLNTKATQAVVEFCKHVRNLKALVHVSTAYSNADKRLVEELVYAPPADPRALMDTCRAFDDETTEALSACLLRRRDHPNTYTLTKAAAEWIVQERADSYPAAIVRPSIVTAAWREPVPGWVDNVSGITGIMCEIGRGTIRSIICDDRLVVDIVPVDVVVDTLITAAWHVHTHRSNSVRVYNCTSGSVNRLEWHELGRLTRQHALAVPSKHIQWYPGFKFRTNRLAHWIVHLLFHFMPAFFIDTILRLQGNKPIMMRICDKIKRTAKTGEFFALHEWDFRCGNQKSLATDMREKDRVLFSTDISTLRWDEYVKHYMIGIRKYILKDSMDSLPAAKSKLQRFYVLHRLGQLAIAFLLLKLVGLLR